MDFIATLPRTQPLVTMSRPSGILLAGLLLALGARAAPIDLAGVQLDDVVELHGTSVPLNGAGVRHWAIIKVYVAALYLGSKAATPAQAYGMAGPRRLRITLLRDIESKTLASSMTEAFENNTPADQKRGLAPAMARLAQSFTQGPLLRSGQTITFDWVPSIGTVLSVDGAPRGEAVQGVEFFNALLRGWLGPHPADPQLKDALLGLGAAS